MLIRPADPNNATPVTMEGAERVSMQIMVGREDKAPNFSLRHFVVEPAYLATHPFEPETVVSLGSRDLQ